MSTCQRKATVTRHPQKALKISAKARYALRILKDISDHQNGELATTESAIAKRQGLSEKFLSRIVLPLRDAKIVSVQRGSRDGFTLLKKPEEISLAVVQSPDVDRSRETAIDRLKFVEPNLQLCMKNYRVIRNIAS